MTALSRSENLLLTRIRAGDAEAWTQLISQFEGRLLAYIEKRTRDRAAAEDVVQEAFIGFLTSLPNFDGRRPLEAWLFSIAAHKLTDHLRRQGRRPTLPMVAKDQTSTGWQPADRARPVSSIARSSERRHIEETALTAALAEQIDHWRRRGQWERLCCAELLFVRGLSNKDAAGQLNLSEQTVANYKFEFLAKLRAAVRRQGLPEEVFPELQQEKSE